MSFIPDILSKALMHVFQTLVKNWPYLLASTAVAGLLNAYLDAARVSSFLKRYRRAGVIAATAVAVATPLCSCGTTAVILGMMAGRMPWAPVVAFMVSSPLTSPQGLVYNAGLFGWPFALAFFGASIALGLGGGLIASILENKGWLAGQWRYAISRCRRGTVESLEPNAGTGCGCGTFPVSKRPIVRLRQAAGAMLHIGPRLLILFLAFSFAGTILNRLIPAEWASALFGKGHAYSVPLAALLGLPIYINAEASLPLVQAMIGDGMSRGAVLAFLIAGAGTSIGAISGALTIARRRLVGLVVGILWTGAVVFGYAYDVLLTTNFF